ncbi:hypothetical protein BT96DRAFT_951122 [Gymnopus androsaceus JB14]|uniref:DUF4100 domain-containing protein n=1 Tax=Gymnopus androsaceus JB14 TaxID=1447944 RepID=A0A6A4GDQ3_9AGAR|nr:hypothetical protein BT96DRAFT_951122 [Gymnopus androsaceus JB14]
MATTIPAVPIVVPMPVPGTTEAPKFNGHEVDRFLKKVLSHGKKAGIIDNDDLVNYLLEYCDRTRYEDLRYDPEFQSGKAGRTWDKASARLKLLYLALNELEEVTSDDLKEYCQKSFFSGSFETKTDIHRYATGYRRIANALINSQEITDLFAKQTFLTGLPKYLATYVMEKSPAAHRKRKNPPTIDEVVTILYDRLRKEALDWNPYEHAKRRTEKGNSKVRFDDEASDSGDESDTETPAPTPKTTNAGRKVNEATTLSEDKYEALVRKMNEMSIALANANAAQQRRPQSPRYDSEGRRCFMCGQVHAFPLSPGRCNETGKLVKEGILIQDQSGRYTLPDGRELPRWDGVSQGGLAEMLRASRSRLGRDVPPHQVNHVTAHPASLSYGSGYESDDVLNGDVFAVSPWLHDHYERDEESAYYENIYFTDAATRSGKNTDSRYDPADQAGRHTRRPDQGSYRQISPPSNKQPPPKIISHRTNESQPMDGVQRTDSRPQPPPSRSQRPPAPPNPPGPPVKKPNNDIPPPPNPINRHDGWKNSLPSKDPDTKQGPKPPNQQTQTLPQGTHYHYTSDIQDRADPQKVLDQILQVKVTLSVGEIIGEGKKNSIQYDTYDTDNIDVAESLRVEVQDPGKLNDFLVRYSNSVAQMPNKRYFAMTTGIMEIKLGGFPFRAMIDSGSELNVVSYFIPEQARLVLDTEGMRWSLKGIHGDAEPLRGVILDAPIQLGSHMFPHHLFVSSQKVNRSCSGTRAASTTGVKDTSSYSSGKTATNAKFHTFQSVLPIPTTGETPKLCIENQRTTVDAPTCFLVFKT